MMKNKKAFWLTLISFLLIIGVFAIIFIIKDKTESFKIKSFELGTYQWAIDNFPDERNVGEITDAEIAIQKAKMLWMEENYDLEQVKIEVAYNSSEACWHIRAKTDIPGYVVFGGVYHALIKTDGDVVAVWFED